MDEDKYERLLNDLEELDRRDKQQNRIIMDITLTAKSAEVSANNYRMFDVNLFDVDMEQILDHFTIKEVIKHFDVSKILDEIGEDEVKSHFNLQDAAE